MLTKSSNFVWFHTQ